MSSIPGSSFSLTRITTRWETSTRGLNVVSLSRPSLAEILEYRAHVDHSLEEALTNAKFDFARWQDILEVGLQHEQQHQELILTDVKHLFFLQSA